jgi:hypothetical protein
MTDDQSKEQRERFPARGRVAQAILRALEGDEDGANAILHSLTYEELRFFAGAAIEQATALAVNAFGCEQDAARYAEVVMLNAAIETPEEA